MNTLPCKAAFYRRASPLRPIQSATPVCNGITYLTIRRHSTCHGMLPLCQSSRKNFTPQAEEDIADELQRLPVDLNQDGFRRAG
jgi:hypothetical protein